MAERPLIRVGDTPAHGGMVFWKFSAHCLTPTHAKAYRSRIRNAVGALSVFAAALAGATPPPQAVVDGCLAAKARPGTRMVRVPKAESNEDNEYVHGFRADFYRFRNAIQPVSQGGPLPRIDVNLSDWLLFAAGSTRHLCVSSNFVGLGRSGVHQNIRFAYLLSLGGRRRLYWLVGDAAALR